MTARRYTEISCDATGCGRAYSNGGSAVDVRHLATTVGDVDGLWNYTGGNDWCPDHRTRASRMFIIAPGVTPSS